MSYGTRLPDSYRQVGGAKPADLPPVQSIRFEFVINLKAAKSLGLTIPTFFARAEEVFE